MANPAIAVVAGGASLLGAKMSASAAKDAAQTQADAATVAALNERAMFEQQREDLAPYREMGYGTIKDITAMKPYLTQQFGSQQALAPYLDPSMAFRMKYGTEATERLANVGGGAVSGNTLRRLTEFGQELAGTEYANAFNRAQSERQNIYNTLANIAGMGQGAVNTGVQASQNLAENLTGLTTGSAAAQAAGTVGAANAYSGALQTPMNYMMLSSLMGRNPLAGFGGTSAAGMPAASSSIAPQAATFQYA